eukprot:3690955-Pyramimonas_sp.AAC.1
MKYCLCTFLAIGPGGLADAPTGPKVASPATVRRKRLAKAMMLKAEEKRDAERHVQMRMGWPSPD